MEQAGVSLHIAIWHAVLRNLPGHVTSLLQQLLPPVQLQCPQWSLSKTVHIWSHPERYLNFYEDLSTSWKVCLEKTLVLFLYSVPELDMETVKWLECRDRAGISAFLCYTVEMDWEVETEKWRKWQVALIVPLSLIVGSSGHVQDVKENIVIQSELGCTAWHKGAVFALKAWRVKKLHHKYNYCARNTSTVLSFWTARLCSVFYVVKWV